MQAFFSNHIQRAVRALPFLFAVAAMALTAPACALITTLSNASDSTSTALGSASDSLQSVSTSVRSISNSLASVSGSFVSEDDDDKERDSAYRRDVRVLTSSYLTDGAAATTAGTEFRRDLGKLAERHGISNWKSEASTYEAIGAGLRQAGVRRQEITERFAGTHPQALRMIERGYDQAARG